MVPQHSPPTAIRNAKRPHMHCLINVSREGESDMTYIVEITSAEQNTGFIID